MQATHLKISESGTHFVDGDGTPFFWLGDTAWNGALKATPDQWDLYLETRARQGFTVIQFVLTHWRGAEHPLHGRIYDEVDGKMVENETALAQMDAYIRSICAHGMIPCPVMFWSNNPIPPKHPEFGEEVTLNPYFSESAMKDIGGRMLARWQQFHPVWMLGGDGEYNPPAFAEMWRRIGREVFKDHPDALATMHPCGCTWVGDIFAREPWYSFAGYQSGHGNSAHDTRWHVSGPVATRWEQVHMPIVDLEVNYEGATAYHSDLVYTPFHVRRGCYWGLLGAPTAGVTYGTNGIWAWLRQAGEPAEGHGQYWSGPSWKDCLELEGVASLQHMIALFKSLPWTQLRPADHILAHQPGWEDHQRTIKAAMTRDESLAVVYTPAGGRITLQHPKVRTGRDAYWFDPRTGKQTPATIGSSKLKQAIAETPTDEDWLLVLALK